MSQGNVFNCFLVGEKSSGKASFLYHHFPRDTSRTNGRISGEGILMLPLIVSTSVGTIQFNIWDIDGMHGKCLVPTDCAIIFKGVSQRVAMKSSKAWQADLVVVIESIKLIIACSNVPFNSFGNLNEAWMEKCAKKSVQLNYNNLMSLDSPHNVERIFLWLSRKLLHTKKLEFFSYPVFLPRFFVRAQIDDQEFCSHCFCVMVTNALRKSALTSSTSSTESIFSEEESLMHKGAGDFKSMTKQSEKNRSKEEVDKTKSEEEKSIVQANYIHADDLIDS